MFMLVRSVTLLWFSFFFIYLTSTLLAQPEFYRYQCGNPDNVSNYTAKSTFKTNLDTTLSNLPATNNGFGFYNLSTGQGIDRVNALALCRGDINPDICQSCINDSIIMVRKVCPNSIYVVGWYPYCSLVYSNDTLLGNTRISVYKLGYEAQTMTNNVDKFNNDLRSLLDKLKEDAATGGALKKFAGGKTPGPDFITIYAIMQCSPDLSKRDCIGCLDFIMKYIQKFNGSLRGIVLVPKCNIRYSEGIFFNESIASVNLGPSSSLPSPPGKKRNTLKIVIIVIVASTFIGVIIMASLCIFMRLKKKKKQIVMPPNSESMEIGTAESLHYEFSAIQVATNDFSEHNKLGRGGFGAVYKGVLENGHQVAVKRLARDSGQGDIEFKNEVLLLAKLQHRNLVKLLGFSTQGSERVLIYEFLANASLDQFIFDSVKRTLLDWEKRYKIIIGVARGLLYLHEDSRLKIVHRDMKASNVLLDAEMNAKIADFGMARLFKQEETQANTNIIVGTHGYMAPEYVIHGQFSVRSDVFSFGVLVLEMITGQRNQCYQIGESVQDLLTFAWTSWKNGALPDLIDSTLQKESGSASDITRTIHIGLLCIQQNVMDRPTMGSVVTMLNSVSMMLPQPSEPALFMRNNSTNSRLPPVPEFSSSTQGSSLEKREPSKTTMSGSSQFSGNDVSVGEIVPR